MNLVFLYGPPGVGKLTVAEELVTLTGYKLLHNHQILNFLSDIFGFKNPTRKKLSREFRFRIFEEAAKENINMIITFGAAREEFDFFDKTIEVVESNNGKVCFVQLLTTKEELLRRIENESRKKHGKIDTKEFFETYLLEYPGMFDTYPKRDHVTIDNTTLSPKETAKAIITYYNLA